MNKQSHIFIVLFFALIIILQISLYTIYGADNKNVTPPSTLNWMFFLVAVFIHFAEKFKLLYWYLIFAGLLVLLTISFQVTVFMQSEAWWYKATKAFAIPFALYIYFHMYLDHPWKVFRRYKQMKSKI